ncbi:MAG: hypothetical protein HYZ75_09755 [Elusimicrobia bacterium]|nr:hypothetical protein [Elusimicrobiota bacterium]
MDKYRIDKQGLWDILEAWGPFFPKKVRVVACGGTALTIQDLKESTKDVDFLVPDVEDYKALLGTIERLHYRQVTGSGWARDDGFIFDLFKGKVIFQTELLDSPLDEGNHIPIKTFKKLEVSALNDLDLIISKMFRGDEVDVEDCLRLIAGRGKAFDLDKLKERYKETASYTLRPESMMKNLDLLLAELKDE